MEKITVRLEDGTVGIIEADEENDGMLELGEVLRVHLHDENGMDVVVTGKLAEILQA
ncbi:MAG: hypothetical protein WC450_08650 [Candidatus Omnitrophota bacterium]|jgi:hypothetical protein